VQQIQGPRVRHTGSKKDVGRATGRCSQWSPAHFSEPALFPQILRSPRLGKRFSLSSDL